MRITWKVERQMKTKVKRYLKKIKEEREREFTDLQSLTCIRVAFGCDDDIDPVIVSVHLKKVKSSRLLTQMVLAEV